MSAIFYGNIKDLPSTLNDWSDDEEFEELEVDKKSFEITYDIKNDQELLLAQNIFFSFFITESPKNLTEFGLIKNKYLNGVVYKIKNEVFWFKFNSIDKYRSRSIVSKVMMNFCTSFFDKFTIKHPIIHLISQQSNYDQYFEYFTNTENQSLKEYQIFPPFNLTKISEGLIFEFLIKKNLKMHLYRLPMILDNLNDKLSMLPKEILECFENKNNYLVSSNNLYA